MLAAVRRYRLLVWGLAGGNWVMGMSAMVSGAYEGVVDVGHPDPDDVCSPGRFRCAPVRADVRDDYGAVLPDGQLGPMTLAKSASARRSRRRRSGSSRQRERLGRRAPVPPWAAGPTD